MADLGNELLVGAAAVTLIGYVGNLIRRGYGWAKRLETLLKSVGERTEVIVPDAGPSMRDDITSVREDIAELRCITEMHGEQIKALSEAAGSPE